jgi:UDP-glucose 4-epimerase
VKRILLTGAAGFLGRAVARRLKLRTDVEDVLAIDNFDPLCGGENKTGDVVFGDVLSSPHYDPTHIIHLAALGRNLTCEENPHRAFMVNVGGTLAMLELAKGWKAQMLFCSSNIVLSSSETMYRLTKRTAEQLVQVYARHGLNVMTLRPSNIAGPGQSRTEFQPCSFAAMDRCYEQKGHIEITGDGWQRRDYVHVDDVARAFMLGLDRMIPGTTFDICTGKLIAINEVAEMLAVPVKHVEPRPGDARSLVSDHRPASNQLDFRATIGIEQTVRESFPTVFSGKSLHSS